MVVSMRVALCVVVAATVLLVYLNLYRVHPSMELHPPVSQVSLHPGIDYYLTPPPTNVAGQQTSITTIIVTCCRKSAPSILKLQECIESLRYAPALAENLLIAFDGAKVDPSTSLDEKCKGECNEGSYYVFKHNAMRMARERCRNVCFVEMKTRACLSVTLYAAMCHVQTPLVNIMQEDLPLTRSFDVDTVVHIVASDEAVDMIRYSSTMPEMNIYTNRDHIEFGERVCSSSAAVAPEMRGGLELTRANTFSDQNHITTRHFYNRHIWPNIPQGSFMEHSLFCLNRKRSRSGAFQKWHTDEGGILPPTIWMLGGLHDAYAKHTDGRA